jgi:DNA-binding transcriptional LysR family regulator
VGGNRLVEMDAFVRVVKNQNFVAAASELGISPALLTRRVQHLEADLGVRIITRTTRRLSLTEPGKRYYDFCVRILQEMQEEESAIKHLQNEPTGPLNVYAPTTLGIMEMGKAVTSFMVKYPKIQVTLTIGSIERRTLDPSEYGADVAIGFSHLKDSSLHMRKIGKIGWTLCASATYLRKTGAPKSPAELIEHSCLVTRRPFANGVWTFNGPAGAQKIKVSGVISPSNAITMRYMALDGAGVALLPNFCITDDLRKRKLLRVLPEWRTPEQPVCAYYPHGRQQSLKMRLFLDYLKVHFENAAWTVRS